MRFFDRGKVKSIGFNYFDSAIENLEADVVKVNGIQNEVEDLESRSDFNDHGLEHTVTYNSNSIHPLAIRDHNIYNYRIKRSFRASRLSAIPLLNRSRNAVRSPHCFDEYETDFSSPIRLCSPGTFMCNLVNDLWRSEQLMLIKKQSTNQIITMMA